MRNDFLVTLIFVSLVIFLIAIFLAIELYRRFNPKSLEKIYLEEMQKLRFKWVSSILIKYLVQKRIKRDIPQGEHKSLMKKLRDKGLVEELKPTPRKENFFFTIPEYRLTEKGKRNCSLFEKFNSLIF